MCSEIRKTIVIKWTMFAASCLWLLLCLRKTIIMKQTMFAASCVWLLLCLF